MEPSADARPPAGQHGPAEEDGRGRADGAGLTFRSVAEEEPGERWKELFEEFAPAYRRWFLREGDAARPSYLACRRALREHMPELVPTWERLVDLAGGGDLDARLLSLYRPTPYLTGCSQAVWTRDVSFLVRNYDYAPTLLDGVALRSAWHGRPVIASTDLLWGVLDGMNEDGLAVSLSFGGRAVVGDGFGIPLILRYVLQRCRTVPEAARLLRRIPSHMAYNVTILDAQDRFATAYVAPDRATKVVRRPAATNHQRRVEWHHYERITSSVEREEYLGRHLENAEERPERFVRRFLEPPLFRDDCGLGWCTLYTAVYRPGADVHYLWRGGGWRRTFEYFPEETLRVAYERTVAAEDVSP